MADKFYPKLSNIISVDSLPVQLNFIEGGLQQIFNGLGYRNFKISHSADNITTSVHIEIVSYKELKIGIPGSDLGISLNSDFLSGGNSIIPVTLSFSLGIKKYIKNFNISGFSFTPEEIFKTLFKVICLSDSDIILSIASNNFSTSNIGYTYTPCDALTSLTGIAKFTDNNGTVINPIANQTITAVTHPNGSITLKDLISASLPSGHTFNHMDVILEDDLGGAFIKSIGSASGSVTFNHGDGGLALSNTSLHRTYFATVVLYTNLCSNGSSYSFTMKYS